jgi:hypothetical protein
MDIRKATCLIIERDGEFLVAVSELGFRWSVSPYDAWSTRDKMTAFKVAWRVRGRLFLFNPIVGQLKELK